jgi:metallo-beta-lactamase family protein
MSNPKLTFCSGVGTVTGANFLLETAANSPANSAGGAASKNTHILIDCGLEQGEKVANDENREPFPYDIKSIDALIITHAHLDHVGRIPKLVREGYKGPIYSTPETRALAELVLRDAVGLLDMEARREGLLPLYEVADVDNTMTLWKTIQYHEDFKISDDISIFLKDSGHILGASMVEMTVNGGATAGEGGTKILFTGDLGNSPAPLLRDTESVGNVDYLVMESVYGDRNHEKREERQNRLKDIINETLGRGGTLIIPAFAIDRTQIILFELNNLVEKGLIPSVPVFVDSPMATEATRIYAYSTELFNDAVKAQMARGDDVFSFPKLQFTVSQDQSRNIEHIKGAKIILAGSGMSVGGRVIGHEEFFLPDPKNTILLVGYQTPGSIGRQLSDGAKKVHIHDRTIQVKAQIETVYGYSAHKDSDHLVEFVATTGEESDDGAKSPGSNNSRRLKKVFVVMGEPGASMHLAQRINDELDGNAIVPEKGKEYVLV